MIQLIRLFILFAFVNTAFSQTKLSGKVIDAETKQPLAFANLVFNHKQNLTVTSDIDGKFNISASENITSVACSYVGYDRLVTGIKDPGFIVIPLKSSNALDEVLITPEDNPANRIIRNVIKNKDKNNPEHITSFKYTSYNKIVYDLETEGDTKRHKENLEAQKNMKSHLFIMESVSERKFIAPDFSEEVVTGSRVSGFKNPTFASLATDLQPFSFYKDNIKLFDVQYLNPISNGSLKKYNFRIEDTIFQNRDTVYVISFKPKKDKNFEALKGTLYINTNKYAVQNVIAAPFEKTKIAIRIQQQYTLIKGKYWFPEQLNYKLSVDGYIEADGRSYIKDVELETPLRKRDFAIESVRIDKMATKKDSLFWDKHRAGELTQLEDRTYKKIDSIGRENNFDRILSVVTKAVQLKIPIGIFDLDVSKTFVYNKYEGWRPGIGLFTNEKFSGDWHLGGFFGYGLKDYEWKYGGEIQYTFSHKNEFTVAAKYQNNLVEAGSYGLNYSGQNAFTLRNFIAFQMDRIRQQAFAVGFRSMRYFKWDLTLGRTETTPQYPILSGNPSASGLKYVNTDARVDLRFAFREKLVESLNQRVSVGSEYPIFYLSYSRGLKDLFDGSLDYNKIEARLEQTFFTKNLGMTKFRFEGGFIDNPVPYGLMFTGEGSYDKDYPYTMPNYFQTMLPYEFLSDRYSNLFLSHNFGTLLFQAGKFRPSISVHNNLGWGDLSNASKQQFTGYKTKNKVFSEAGLQFDGIYKIDYLNVGFLGFGAGVYYRYGAYQNPEFNDNIAYKLSMVFSIK
jgi:hypothetical protein